MLTIAYAAHTAHLDELSGAGVLVLPLPAHDMPDPLDLDGVQTLHGADWDRMVTDLSHRGWEPLEGEDGGLMVDGRMADGREVVALYSPAVRLGTPDDLVESQRELHALAGIVAATV